MVFKNNTIWIFFYTCEAPLKVSRNAPPSWNTLKTSLKHLWNFPQTPIELLLNALETHLVTSSLLKLLITAKNARFTAIFISNKISRLPGIFVWIIKNALTGHIFLRWGLKMWSQKLFFVPHWYTLKWLTYFKEKVFLPPSAMRQGFRCVITNHLLLFVDIDLGV